ncbi:MAG TPA: UDP-2,4-diacetamido-2,4,6-trideoxy-beta-L-altropyranose hydrolase [Opitutaceae bacterium]|nr:UDP-2,4-diacetamido-2,4,6-trideoxy-beta-L-altropyranose hydrolase [Opitutaceae bacterium]
MPNVLFIRADGSSTLGTGHVMRCLALAQSWVRGGGQVVWALAETTPALNGRLRAEGFSCLSLAVAAGSPDDASSTIAHARAAQAAWIVADGYRFGSPWQKQVKAAGFRLLVVDDYGHAGHYHADLILNQNASAPENLYNAREAATRLLLGAPFVLLRQEFLTARPATRAIPAIARKILVTLGGSDPDNLTSRVIGALGQISEMEVVVVVGGSNPHLDAVKRAVATCGFPCRLEINATNMPELMAWADVAISAAGSTAWELAYMGLPSLLIVVAENQAGIAAALAREGVSQNLGAGATLTAAPVADALRALLADQARRQTQSRKGRNLVDGLGVDRVLTSLAA